MPIRYRNSIFKSFSSLNLDSDLDYDLLIIIINSLHISVNKNQLFDEINTFNKYKNSIILQLNSINIFEQYIKIFKVIECPNIMKIISSVMCIAVGNDYVERVFSHMTRIWTDDRNRMSISLLRAEICIKNNFSHDCIQFKEFIKSKRNCIIAAKSNTKYIVHK